LDNIKNNIKGNNIRWLGLNSSDSELVHRRTFISDILGIICS